MIGSVVDGKYEVIRLLGQGGMGAVFEVRHTATDRRLALKVIQAGDPSKIRALVLRLQREARAAGSIDSAHIGQVVDAGDDPATGTPYLVMELLDGEDLQQVLNRVGALPPEVALRVVAQACLGLEKAHEARVIHRDVKPANLFVARQRDGSVLIKVLDFGIAKLKQEDLGPMESGSLTRTGSVLGSPLYMSPEQARGAKAIDHRADLWSLGVVAYQLLTNRTPYQEIDALGELILAICSELPPCVQDFAPWVDPGVAATIHRALSLDAADRYQTAGEMFAAIAEHLPRGADGRPDLALREDMLIGVDAEVRSVTAPRLMAETGRRPAWTAGSTSRHVITPIHATGDRGSTTGNRGDRVSAAEIEAGPTLMIAPGDESRSSPPGDGPRAASDAATTDARGRTEAGLSRSSPAAAPSSRGPLLAGVAAAAVVIGVGVALLTRGALGGPAAATADAASASGPPAASAAPTASPAASLVPTVAPAGEAGAPTPSAAPPPSAAASSAASAAASPATSSASGRGRPPPARPATATPAASSAAPAPPAPAGTSGFGDRK